MDYALLRDQMLALSETENGWVPLLANVSALLYEALEQVNWAGFYRVRGEELILGPFQGKAACVRIARGRGVCGTAWAENRTVRVENVHLFPGHIACDGASQSEIVIPLRSERGVEAVMDIDSPVLNRFTEADQKGLEQLAQAMEEVIQWTK